MFNRFSGSCVRNFRPLLTSTLRREISESAWTCCKVGKYILIDDIPHKVTKTQQGGRGRGASFVKCTVQNLYSWKNSEKTFKSTDELEIPVISFEQAQYSWYDSMAEEYVFMDSNTFEEIRIQNVSKAEFLQEGHVVTMQKFGDRIVDTVLPISATYTVVKVDDSNPMKGGFAARLCSGAVIPVPGHIKDGMTVSVNIATESYITRVQ